MKLGLFNYVLDTARTYIIFRELQRFNLDRWITMNRQLYLAIGSKLSADKFLNVETLGILALGAVAFSIGTATGVLMAKLMNRLTGGGVNPLIGAAGVSAVPMAARVVNKVGLEADHHNFLLMHAMGPNVAGVIGSAVAAGILLAIVGGG